MLKIDFLGTLKIESEGMNITDKLSSKSQALIAILMTKEIEMFKKRIDRLFVA